MHIAPLRRSDIEAAKRVIATVVLEYYFDGRCTADVLLIRYEKSGYLADLSRLEEEYGGTHGLLLGAFEGEAVVGTGGVRQIDTDSGELVRLWLLRDYRGRGVGRQIVDLSQSPKQSAVSATAIGVSAAGEYRVTGT
jgi:putative acetyltransferase